MANASKTQAAPARNEKIAAEMIARGVKFLPSQATRRIAEPSASLKVLGSARRNKAAKIAARELAAKQAATAKAAAAVKK